MKNIVTEVAVDSYQSALNADLAKAKRVELCSDLVLGGLTPSIGLYNLVRKNTKLDIVVMIRPRSGDFCYSASEIEHIIEDIKVFSSLKADALVVGILNGDFSINLEAMKKVIKAAKNTPIVFHRAFDVVNDQFKELENLKKLGVKRILTSGAKPNCDLGLERIKELVKVANGEITIMPGAGVNANNADKILQETKATEIHFTAKSIVNTSSLDKSKEVNYSSKELNEHLKIESEVAKITEIIDKIKAA
ncbi:copper homeostasis protein CutC [Mycoplasmopsis fermentans]|uniref:copper homeostasis protein CutC n=1 Tax=Mycoplasmopsis fermentans TaxID=2115 RepID=UPI0001E33111|nr:copper homeostasis protein CutC [Mycoplasmopsis fermentans]ADN69029.1 copper homeostasis protein [Mycoplasmopsis fermentans JER]